MKRFTMKTKLYEASSRGYANYGWLDTHYSFSFADYYNPDRIHFGNLRVLNDDIVQTGSGFGKHPHDNMEIVTVPIYGKLSHKDSMGHEQTIGPDEVQVMSAGTGIFHSEYNNSNEDVNILQLWIFPKTKNTKPTYDQAVFNREEAQGKWQFLVNGEKSPLTINQQARISRVFIEKDEKIEYSLMPGAYGNFLFVIDGAIEVENTTANKRDAIEITQTEKFSVTAKEKTYLLNIEL